MTFDLFRGIGSIQTMTDTAERTEPETSNEALISLIARDRSREAYRALFLRFAPKLKAFVMGQGLSAQEAEDLAQETLISVWRKADYFDPSKAAASTWIYTIARNLRIDQARKAKRQQDMPEALKEDLQSAEADVPADAQMIAHQSASALNLHIQTLPKEQKEVLRLSFFEDLSHGDISRALNLPLGTVKSRLRLAIMRLRVLMLTAAGRKISPSSNSEGEC